MAFYSAFPCWEIDNTAKSNAGLNGNAASVVLGCAYADRFLVGNDILQNRRVWPAGTGTGAPRAVDVQITGFGLLTNTQAGSPQLLDYGEARLNVTYEPLSGEVPENPEEAGYDLLTEGFETQVDGKRLDHTAFLWKSASGAADQLEPGDAPVIQVRRMRLTREFYGLAVLPTYVLNFVGKCNNAAYFSNILNLNFPAETLLFGQPVASRTIRTDGSDGWNLKLSLSYKEEGWNKFFRMQTNDYDTIVRKWDSGDVEIYPPVDMSALFG